MPIYEYRCENGHDFEIMQRMSDDALSACVECGAPVQRVFHPVAIHFKGSGFYNTDYGKRRRGGSASPDGDGAAKDSGGDSKEPATSTSTSSKSESGSSGSS